MNGEPSYRLPPDWRITAISTPFSETYDWSLKFLGIPDLWKQTRGKGVKVCILDTGVDASHQDLQGAIAESRDFTGSPFGAADRVGHGTHCAGLVGARAGNNIGVAGIAPECTLFCGKVLGDNGAGSDQSIAAGLRWAMQVDVDIVSLSLGGPQMSGQLRAIFQQFISKPRKFIFAAAGNSGPGSPPNYPGAWEECISVAAVDEQGNVTNFSSRGEYVDIAAPGYKIISTIPGGYGEMSGTSEATPEVAAIGALMLAKHISQGGTTGLESTADMLAHMKATSKDQGVPGRDREYGFGLIDPAALLADIQDPPEPAPLPPPEEGKELDLGGIKIHIPARVGDKLGVAY